jgi:glutathione synthase/RimK-type ligase-like ATP-grasp enzyme
MGTQCEQKALGRHFSKEASDHKRRMKNVLIATTHCDPHADKIIIGVRKRGHRAIRLHPEDFPQRASHSTYIDDHGYRAHVATLNHQFDMSEVTSVLWRRPVERASMPNHLTETERRFAQSEHESALRGILANTECLWMSRAERIYLASHKIEQLRRAARFGFGVPKSMVTSDPDEAIAFIESLNGPAIYKTLGVPIVYSDAEQSDNEHGTGIAGGIPTTVVTKELVLSKREAIRMAPCLFQEYVEKRFEYRVTIVGDEVFPARIDSQAHAETRIDWRSVRVPMRISRGEMPSDLVAQCVRFVKSYGLTFSAMDLIERPDGRWVFLENNANGQWAFVEQLVPEFRIADTIIDYLLGERRVVSQEEEGRANRCNAGG